MDVDFRFFAYIKIFEIAKFVYCGNTKCIYMVAQQFIARIVDLYSRLIALSTLKPFISATKKGSIV